MAVSLCRHSGGGICAVLAGCAQVFSLQRRMMVKTSRVSLPLEGLILHTYERSLCGRDIWATKNFMLL